MEVCISTRCPHFFLCVIAADRRRSLVLMEIRLIPVQLECRRHYKATNSLLQLHFCSITFTEEVDELIREMSRTPDSDYDLRTERITLQNGVFYFCFQLCRHY